MNLEKALEEALNYTERNINFGGKNCNYFAIRDLLQKLRNSIKLKKADKITLSSIRKYNAHDIMINDVDLSKLISEVTYQYDIYFHLIDPDFEDIMNNGL